jgi:hypothetical protein
VGTDWLQYNPVRVDQRGKDMHATLDRDVGRDEEG